MASKQAMNLSDLLFAMEADNVGLPANLPELIDQAADEREAEKMKLLEAAIGALQSVRKLLDAKQLVRNIEGDEDSGWAVRNLPLVMTIQSMVGCIDRASTLGIEGKK